MKIKTRLRINTFISLGVVILIVLSLVWSFLEVSRATRNVDLIEEMRKVAFERILLRDEYLLHGEERAGIQWHAKSETLRGLLESASRLFSRSEEKALVKETQRDFDATFTLFSELIEDHKRENLAAKKVLAFTEKELRLAGQTFLRAYALNDDIGRLHESAQKTATSAREREIFIIVVFVAGGVIAITINSAFINRTLAKRITMLHKGVEIIGAGDLDYHIVAGGDDELSALALASNEMAAKLKQSHTSVENLKKEIAERKLAEEAVRESEARFQMMVSSVKDYAIIMLDAGGQVASWNAGAERIKGYQEDEIVGQHFSRFYPQEDVDSGKPERELAVAAAEGRIEDEGGRVRKDGSRFMANVVITALRDDAGQLRGFAKVVRDITERKKAEEALNRYTAELKRSNEELQQFAYIASHDLQEPLRMIASYLQLIEMRYKGRLDKDADEFIAFAVEGANRLQNMIVGLLAYSRVGTKGTPFAEANCSEVLEKAVSNLKITIEESGAIITSDRLPVINADESQLIQVFQNLISNAIKFKGSEVPRIHISAEKKDMEWLFSVKDNGTGIPPQYKDRIFKIFQRLHGREYPGVGIGLSLCRRIVERHGGVIWFDSEAGEGTTFYFTIPINPARELSLNGIKEAANESKAD
ncbi:MAG: sensor histidine kinase [Dissulfurispiraceae bacterium]